MKKLAGPHSFGPIKTIIIGMNCAGSTPKTPTQLLGDVGIQEGKNNAMQTKKASEKKQYLQESHPRTFSC